MSRLFYLLFAVTLFLGACSTTKKIESKNKFFIDRNILWYDATANFDRFCNKDSILYYLKKSKEVGVTDIVVDVKPITGEVLYPSNIAPVMNSWGTSGVKKDLSLDIRFTTSILIQTVVEGVVTDIHGMFPYKDAWPSFLRP